MKILFLDDDPTRHKKFQQAHIGLDVTYVWTAQQAIEALEKYKFDQASLDHDLGGEDSHSTTPDLGKGSGYDVAMHIVNLPEEQRPDFVVVHSFNPEGARRMAYAMRDAVKCVRKIPFAY